jgi:lysophospholipase L1-like esterase
VNKRIFSIYVFMIHCFLIFILTKSDFLNKVYKKIDSTPDEVTPYYRELVSFHSRIDKNLPLGSVLIIGDSHIQGLAVSAISPLAVNYGIGNDTTVGVIQRLPLYKSIENSRAVVLSIGFNDLRRRDNAQIYKNIDKILEYFPPNKKVILCSINPVAESNKSYSKYKQRIIDLNLSFSSLSDKYMNTTFLNSFYDLSYDGYLRKDYQLADGVHLNKEGYEVLIKNIVEALK